MHEPTWIDKVISKFGAEEQCTKIIIGEPAAPLAELSAIDPIQSADLTLLRLDPSITSMLGDLLRAVPGLAAAGMLASSTMYTLRFAPDVAAQLGAGTATLMNALNGGTRAIAVNSSGQIIGHPTLVAAHGISTVATATLLWQTLAIVTAQHYLHDMQQQLHAISRAVEDVKITLLHKELVTLISHERYLRRIMHVIECGAVQELDLAAISNQLDHMERECDQVQELMRLSMERQTAHMRRAPIAGWFGWEVEQNTKAAQEHVNDFNNAAQLFAAAVRVKGMLAAFRQHIFSQAQMSSMRLREALEDHKCGQSLIDVMYNIIDERRDEARATIDPLNILHRAPRIIRQQSVAYRSRLNEEFGTIEENLQRTHQHAELLESGQRTMPAVLVERCCDGTLHSYAMPDAVLAHVYE